MGSAGVAIDISDRKDLTVNRKMLLAVAVALAAQTGTSVARDATTITIHKSPWCGCCTAWADAIKKAGYTVRIREHDDLAAIKRQVGVPVAMEACHTAVVDGDKPYVLEGHVPLEAMQKLFAERPDIRGIAVPGMPVGSLGMGDDPAARYSVFSFGADARPAVFYEAGE